MGARHVRSPWIKRPFFRGRDPSPVSFGFAIGKSVMPRPLPSQGTTAATVHLALLLPKSGLSVVPVDHVTATSEIRQPTP